jgi:adenylate cyclase
MDFAAAGLLDGLTGEERKARERLLHELAADGVSIEELKAAVEEERLALLPVDRVLGGRYSAREIEQRTGMPAQFMVRYRRMLGLPEPGLDDHVFADEDVDAAKSTKLFLDAGFREEAIAETTRVLGEGMARLAATISAAFVGTFLQPGDSEQDVATRFASLAEQLTPAFKPILAAAFNQHLRDSVRRGMIGRNELERGQIPEAVEISVCFADLVGFTRLAGQVELQELGTVAGGLAQLAADAVVRPVRLIKTIGDAAMFVSPQPAPLVDVALSLVDAVEAADLPALRAGIASGPALIRAGDYYGHSVNLASRVTGIARPGSVLCTEEVRDAAPDRFEWSFAGRHRLRGVADAPALYRAHPLGQPAAGGSKRRRADRPRRRASR